MARVIMCATPIYGHVAPMRTIAADLVRRGHQVTFLTGTVFRESVERTGAVFAPLAGRADYDLATVDSSERDQLAPGLVQIEWDMRNIFIGALAEQYLALQRLLAEAGTEPVVVLSETMFLGVGPLKLGAPGPQPAGLVSIGVLPFAHSSQDTAPFGMGLPPDSSVEGRARNIAANAFMRENVFAAAQRLYEEVLTELGVPDTAAIPYFIDAVVLAPDRYLQLSIEELSYQRSDTPEHVRFVGALPSAAPTQTALPEWWDEVLVADKVVVVTQGTVANKDFSSLIEPTLQALAGLPVLVIAATGREGEVRDVPVNARVTPFVPFDELLPHTDVLVTNGGFGAVQQSLRHGTPLVLAGQTEDKLEGNVRVAATGAAINLATDNPTPEDIRKAVEDVLTSADFRRNADRLAQQYDATDALEAIAQTVDEFAAS